MGETVSNELLFKVLTDIRNGQTDMRQDIRDLKASNAMILNLIGDLVKGTARGDERIARLEARVEDIEHRLDHDDRPHA
jgi:hypothetical protein